MSSYKDFIARKQRQWGADFSDSELAQQFRRYFESGQRIRVHTLGEAVTGTVGVTTGWRPVFLLMRTRRSIGSSYTLGAKDRVLAVQRGRTYVDVS